MDAWQIGSALAIIGPAAGFVLGRLTSGVTVLKHQVEQLEKRNLRLNGRLGDAQTEIAKLASFKARILKPLREANLKRKLAAAYREAEEAAKRAETHASLAAIVEQGA